LFLSISVSSPRTHQDYQEAVGRPWPNTPRMACCFLATNRIAAIPLDGNCALRISTMSTAPFGRGGKPRPKTRPLVEDVPRIGVGDIARSLLTPRAREEVRVVVNGKPEVLDVVFDDRNYGGRGQAFFLCGTCSKKVQHLYFRDERPVCRQCAGV